MICYGGLVDLSCERYATDFAGLTAACSQELGDAFDDASLLRYVLSYERHPEQAAEAARKALQWRQAERGRGCDVNRCVRNGFMSEVFQSINS